MKYGPRNLKSSEGGDRRELTFVKKGHYYSFGYENGAELSLICALLGMAIDEQFNLDLEDARKLIDALGLTTTSHRTPPA